MLHTQFNQPINNINHNNFRGFSGQPVPRICHFHSSYCLILTPHKGHFGNSSSISSHLFSRICNSRSFSLNISLHLGHYLRLSFLKHSVFQCSFKKGISVTCSQKEQIVKNGQSYQKCKSSKFS